MENKKELIEEIKWNTSKIISTRIEKEVINKDSYWIYINSKHPGTKKVQYIKEINAKAKAVRDEKNAEFYTENITLVLDDGTVLKREIKTKEDTTPVNKTDIDRFSIILRNYVSVYFFDDGKITSNNKNNEVTLNSESKKILMWLAIIAFWIFVFSGLIWPDKTDYSNGRTLDCRKPENSYQCELLEQKIYESQIQDSQYDHLPY